MERVGRDASGNVRVWGAKLAESGWWHSFELPDGRSIQGVNTLESLKSRIAMFPIPQDLSGKRVLDIGAWDGWFSFEMERRGAEVVAVDCVDSKNFRYLHRELRSKIDYRILDMYELSPDTLGTFDIVLFLGVLYHLKHPLLALEKVCALTRDLAAIQTFVSPETGSPVMEFFETDELGGQFDNWVAPNPACVMAMARTAGFARSQLLDVNQFSAASVVCFRHFPEDTKLTAAAPVIAWCLHMTNFGINFRSDLDEYASAWFTCDAETLLRPQVQASVGPFHSAAVAIGKSGDQWQVNFKIPPGLEPGWNQVRIRVEGSDWSKPCRIAIDLPAHADSLAIVAAGDGKTWTPFGIQTGAEAILSLWIDGLPENRDHHNVRINLGAYVLEADFISPWEAGKPTQINAWVPQDVVPGTYPLTVAIGGTTSPAVQIHCK